MKKRRTCAPEQKSKIAIEVLSENQTLTELVVKYEIQPNQLARWKTQFLKNAGRAFSKDADVTEKLHKKHDEEVDELHRQLSQLTVEANWLKKI